MTERPSLTQGDKIRKIPPQEITQNEMPIPPQGWQPYSVEDDTIDLMELLTTLWRYKWLLILLPIFGIIGSYTEVQFLPVEYQSRVTFLQISGNSGSRDLGKFGALASLAGVSLPEKSSDMLTDKIEVVLKAVDLQNRS